MEALFIKISFEKIIFKKIILKKKLFPIKKKENKMIADTILKFLILCLSSETAKDKKMKTKRKCIDKLNKLSTDLQKDFSRDTGLSIEAQVNAWIKEVENLQ